VTIAKTAVLGAGGYGTALSWPLARNCRQVALWSRNPSLVDAIQRTRRNPRYSYLSRRELPRAVSATSDLRAAVDGADLVVVAVSASGLADVYASLSAALTGARSLPVIVGVSKGLTGDGLLPDQVCRRAFPGRKVPYVHLAGPAFAQDIVGGAIVGLVAASEQPQARSVAEAGLAGRELWVYPWHDVIGVEAAGALRTVLSFVFGALFTFGDDVSRSTKAFLLSRVVAEMARFGLAMGGDASTFGHDTPAGLAVVGDLYLCDDPGSRNWQLGRLVAQGTPPVDALRQLQGVAESYNNARTIRSWLEHLRTTDPGLELPWCEAVYAVCHAGVPVPDAVEAILARADRRR